MQINKGKASREAVQRLINDMTDFSEVVKYKLQMMMNETSKLGDTWRDPQYQQFNTFMTELTESLKRDLGVFDDAASALQKKVDMY